MITEGIKIIFDGPPSHESGRFVEVENEQGQSIDAGVWLEREDGLWELSIVLPFHPHRSEDGESDNCMICGHDLRHSTHSSR